MVKPENGECGLPSVALNAAEWAKEGSRNERSLCREEAQEA